MIIMLLYILYIGHFTRYIGLHKCFLSNMFYYIYFSSDIFGLNLDLLFTKCFVQCVHAQIEIYFGGMVAH